MFRVRNYYLPILLGLLLGCGGETKREPALGEAFVGPASLTIRQELGARSPAVATAAHGERLEIIRTRRRFVKVRTSAGVEGWTDSLLLLSPEQMAEIRRVSRQSSNLPSQGKATVYSTLHVHIKPDRQSTWFTQVTEKQIVDVLARRLAPRAAGESPKSGLVLPAPKAPAKKPPKPPAKIPPPPLPKPPKPPIDWLDLSHSNEPPPKQEPQPTPKPVPMDDWNLIRTSDGKVGWVLARMLVMAIPDEVAQYSEGRRITSYFSLGTVQDDDVVKHHWVWTTLSDSTAPYDFDGFRVFIYSLRHHRYETAYKERDLQGYYPAQAEMVQTQYNKKPITAHGFSLITVGSDGQLYKRTFALIGYLIYPVSTTPWQAGSSRLDVPGTTPEAAGASAKLSLWQRVKRWLGWRKD